jgi:1-acyl-sn-glycerol-3-phosphate acyltransferase
MNEREQVIHNIKRAVLEGRFNDKVEVNDPVLDEAQIRTLLYRFLKHRQSPVYGVRNFIARRIADIFTFRMSRDIRIEGLENLKDVRQGAAIITSNHFSPFENCIIRHLLSTEHKGQLAAVSQDTNFAMKGFKGFLLKYIDAVPLSRNKEYMATFFYEQLKELTDKNRWILMYPEQEMWFNYRKPRPCKRGAYFYAHKLQVPVISCFVEILEKPEVDESGFNGLQYVLHVLNPILPDATLNCKEDSLRMADIDYRQKTEAYEKAYGKSLDYAFTQWDIAGWHPQPELATAEEKALYSILLGTDNQSVLS